MNIDDNKELNIARSYTVSKSNTIIQKSRYELSLSEQRTIAYICSMIKPQTTIERASKIPFVLEYEFNIRDYAKICGLSADNGRIYEETKLLLKSLQQKVMWVTLYDGTETTVSWINKAWTNKRSGKAKIRLDEDMIPYLFELHEKFTSYGLKNILAMKSQYSIRLYEILKSFSYLHHKIYDVNEFKKLLMVDNVKSYSNFNLLKTKVIDVAIKEINEFTDIDVNYEPILKGRKTEKIDFTISIKNPLERYLSDTNCNNALKKGCDSI